MSGPGRKDFSTKTKEEITPNHSKPTTQKVKEGVTDTADRATAGVNPDHDKSTTQEVFDKTRREKGHQTNDGPIDKVKGALGMDKH